MVQLSVAEKRRKLREEHEKALASLRATIRKPAAPLSTTPLSITFTANGDSYEHIRDNYDPVLMNEDSSSQSVGEAEALPPLPPEPPPAPPPAPQVEERCPAPVYPPFIPAPAAHMGYWGPGPLQHHMYPAQAFPYPPPHLPYHPHSHYRMPPPPQSINLISVHQEINKVNTVVINLDDPETEPAKCTHNPLGQNNQTVQEAIDSVRKCLKNCEGVKNKDPRLASVDRNKSPERKDSGKNEDKKVKITLNYKPRPVSAVKPDCLLEPAPDKELNTIGATGQELNMKTKPGNYSEKNCKIEGIVSKLKETSSCNNKKEDLENVSKRSESPELCKIQPLRINSRENNVVKDRVSELYDPCITSEDNIEEPEQLELTTKSVDENPEEEIKNIESDTKSANIESETKSANIPKLSKSEIDQINDKINQSFDFILANSIDRKRLTPTLVEINSKKAQELNKNLKDNLELNSPVSKESQMLHATQRMKKKLKKINTQEVTSITTSADLCSSVETVTMDTESGTTNSQQTSQIELTTNAMNPDQKSLYTPRQTIVTTDLTQFQHVFKNKPSNNETISKDCDEKGNLLEIESKMNKGHDSVVLRDEQCQENIYDSLKSASCLIAESTHSPKTIENITEIEGGNSQIIPQNINTATCGNLDIVNKNTTELELTKCFKIKNDGKMTDISSDIHQKEEYPVSVLSKSNYKQELISEGENIKTGSPKKTKAAVDIKIINSLVEKEDLNVLGKLDTEVESNYNTRKNNNLDRPTRSIPTKGELKRFPTPERVFQENISTSKKCEELKSADDKDKESIFHTTTKVSTKEKTKRRSSRTNINTRNKLNTCHDFENSNFTEPNVQEVSNDNERKLHIKEKQAEERPSVKGKRYNKVSKNEKFDDSSIVEPSLETSKNELIKNTTVKALDLENDCEQSSSKVKNFKDAVENSATTKSEGNLKECENGVKVERKHTKITMKRYNADLAQSQNMQPKPCPLSKKEKSYISQNLPSSFVLSTDHHLIKKGFKKLQVRLSKLTSPSSENEALSSDNCFAIENDITRFDEDENNANLSPCNLSKENVVNIVNQESIKKYLPEEASLNQNSQDINKINDDILNKMDKCTTRNPSEEILSHKVDNKVDKNNFKSNENGLKSCDSSDFQDSSNYYEEIINTLNTFRTTPLTCVKERKSLALTTLKVEDIPQAKIIDSPKRMPALTNGRNTDTEQTFDQSITMKISDKEEIQEECLEVVTSNKLADSNNSNNGNCAKNYKSKLSKQNDSDIDDSIILDKELSDLAKDCMDSDSTVGGDDDGLNFGMAESDDSSVDSEFGLRKTTHKKNKLSSPQNIKRRFSKKLKSLGMDLRTKKIENLEKQSMSTSPNHISPEKGKDTTSSVKCTLEEDLIIQQEIKISKSVDDINSHQHSELNQKALNDNSDENNKCNIEKKYNIVKEEAETKIDPSFVLKRDLSSLDILQSTKDDKISNSKTESFETKSVEKLEADSSTPTEAITSFITSRTTRSKSLRTNNSDTVLFKPNNVLDGNLETIGRKTRNKKKTCEITKSEPLKVEKDPDNSLPLPIQEDLQIKEFKEDIKCPQITTRTSSADSVDEPLILLKQKIVSSKVEVNVEIKINSDKGENTFSSDICNLITNEDVKSKIKSCVSDGTTNSGSGEIVKNNSKPDANSNSNESNSSKSNYPNSENILKSQSNISNVSSSDTVIKSSSSTTSVEGSNIISMNTILHGSKEDQDVYLSFFQNKAINPKLKEALKKKRDKAEVDAEIKRRLAEIDELEKLAKNNERIGTRTRSKTSSKNRNHDVVSISSDDSHSTSDLTTLAVDVNKSEGIHEEPSTTLDSEKSLLVHDFINTNDSEKSEILCQPAPSGTNDPTLHSKGKPSIENIQNTLKLHTPENLNESLDRSELNSDFLVKEKPTCHLLPKQFYGSSSGILPSSNLPSDNNSKSYEKEIQSKDVNKAFQKESSASTENIKKSRRNVISVYQFKESDDEDDLEEIKSRRNSNRLLKTRITAPKNCKNKDEIVNKDQPHEVVRKTANINTISSGTTSDLSTDCYEHSLLGNKKQKDLSGTLMTEHLSKQKTMQTLIPEPDSSTSAVTDPNCSLANNEDNASLMAGDSTSEGNIQNSEKDYVESSLLEPSSQLNVVESSPMTSTSFRPPNRKSLVTRRRRKRRFCFGKGVSRRVEQENEIDSLNDCDTKSEEAVSSSVTTLEPPLTQLKQRRKRKTIIDLLMEDSMLSVTRDFPMSPNPYVMPSFYKDIELSNSNNKVETSIIDQNTKKTGITNKSPPKPDVLAQKLRLLEKLKSINRKNRKTRQCRTLVCYNEDSLPESLVETPEGECAQSISDVEMSPQRASLNENKELENNFKDKVSIPSEHPNEDKSPPTEDKPIITATSELRKIRKNFSASKKQHKSNIKKGKLNKNAEETNNEDIISDFKIGITENNEINSDSFEENTIRNNVNSKSVDLENTIVPEKKELSDFDKLLENKSPVLNQGVKFNYQLSITQSPYEDKSNDISDDYYDSFPSPLPSNSDYETTSEGEDQTSKTTCEPSPNIKPGCSTGDYNPSQNKKPKLTIMCSILKEKVGKMLPYFGESGNDSEDSDEDIPLAIKLSKYDKKNDLTSIKHNETLSSAIEMEILPVGTTRPPLLRRSGRIPKESSPVRKSERKCARNCIAPSLNSVESDGIDAPKDNELEELPSQDSQFLVNVKSASPLLRKSSRKSRSPNLLKKETTSLPMEKIGNNSMIKDLLEGNIGIITDITTPAKRRGRASKLKIKEAQNDEEQDLLLVENKSCTEIIKPSPVMVSNELSLIKGRGRKLRNKFKSKYLPFNDENGESLMTDKTEPIEGLDYSTLQQSELDSTSLETVNKCDNQIDNNVCMQQQNSVNDLDDGVNQNNLDSNILSTKPSFESDCNSTKLRNCRKGKLLALNNIRQYFPSENSDSELEIFSDSKNVLQTTRMEKENPVDIVLNESPPPLIKTRSRRPRLNELDNYQEPPNLDTPYSSEIEFNATADLENSIMNSSSLLDKNVNENEESLPKRKGRKPLMVNITKMPENETGCQNDFLQKNKRELNIDRNKNGCEEKQVFTRRRGRRGRRATALKKPCKSTESFFKEVSESEKDFEDEVSMLQTDNTKETIENQDLESMEQLNTTKGLPEENEVLCNENTVSITPTDHFPNCKINSQSDLPLESKRKRKSKNETSELSTATTIIHDSSLEVENEPTKSEVIKKRKLEESEHQEELRTTPSYSAPSTSRNTFRETSATVDPGCNNQSLLWNKISGFLNKTTRSVGTQVKTKNMTLKGFETSEPQVSLQSELTLPQVIKTLFEELKALDSSFSNA